MRVIGGHERNAGLTRKAQKFRVHFLLCFDAVILKLEIVAVLAEQLPHRKRVLFRLVVVAGGKHTGDIARKTGGKADESLAVLREKLEVDSRLCVKALRESFRHHINEIFVSDLVFDEQDEMISGAVRFVALIEAGTRRDVDLAADNRLDSLRLAGAVEIHHAVHDAVVGNCDGILSKLACAFGNLRDAAGAVKQAVFAVQMKMNKRHDYVSPFGFPLFCA